MSAREGQIERTIREARRFRGVSRRAAAILVTGIVAVGLFGGLSFASVLSNVTVTQHAESFGSASSSVANWPATPTLAVATTPSGTAACVTSGSIAIGAMADTYNFVVSPNGTSPACSAGSFAEEWTWTSAGSNSNVETDTFTFSASWTGTTGGAYSGAAALAISVTAAGGVAQTMNIYVEFSQAPAPGQISDLSVIVS